MTRWPDPAFSAIQGPATTSSDGQRVPATISWRVWSDVRSVSQGLFPIASHTSSLRQPFALWRHAGPL